MRSTSSIVMTLRSRHRRKVERAESRVVEGKEQDVMPIFSEWFATDTHFVPEKFLLDTVASVWSSSHRAGV